MRALIPVAAALGAAAVGYATVIERNWFALRRYQVPVLAPGSEPVRVLHLSDAHLTPGRKRLLAWIRSLDDLDPHVVVNTGDSIAHPESVRPFIDALGPLLNRPGVFVLGSNDLYAPEPVNPARYLRGPSSHWHVRKGSDLPWEKLCDDMSAAGWLDLNNQRGRLTVGGLDIALAGVHDSHIKKDRYEQSRVRPTRPLTSASGSCIRPSRDCLTSSPPTATNSCSPDTPTAASCAYRSTAR